jgi:hypothetical protein
MSLYVYEQWRQLFRNLHRWSLRLCDLFFYLQMNFQTNIQKLSKKEIMHIRVSWYKHYFSGNMYLYKNYMIKN